MAGENIRAPFVVDEKLTAVNRAKGRTGTFATSASIHQAFADNNMSGLGHKEIVVPIDGVPQPGQVAELTRENCTIEDLSNNYPTGFVNRAGMFALIPEVKR